MASSWTYLFDRVRVGLQQLPEGDPARLDAEEALRGLEAIEEYEGIRILQLSKMVIVDELGEPVTQAKYEALRDQAFQG